MTIDTAKLRADDLRLLDAIERALDEIERLLDGIERLPPICPKETPNDH